MKPMKKLIATGIFVLLLVACKANTGEVKIPEQGSAPIDAASASTESPSVSSADEARPPPDVIEFVKANYAEQNPTDGAYVQNGIRYTICAYRQAKTPGKYHYLALCSADDSAPEKQIDLYILTADANNVVASNTGILVRSANVSLVSLGGERLGFAVSQSEINQGLISGATTLYAKRDEELPAVAEFIDQLDNTSDPDCKGYEHGCERISRKFLDSVTPDANKGLTIVEQNETNGTSEEKRYTLKFDSTVGKYIVPSELQRSY